MSETTVTTSSSSACGSCGHVIRAYDNIPLVSWVLLRGRCRDCAAPISVRYPLRVGMIAIAAIAVPIIMLGLSPSTWPLVFAMFVAGSGTELFGVGWATAMQEHIPEAILSRVSSYDALGSFVAMPLGSTLVHQSPMSS